MHPIFARTLVILASLLVFLALPGRAAAQILSTPASVMQAFHDALKAGDSTKVLGFLASDAVILEQGDRQTRHEYQQHHLAEDIQFARAVATTRDRVQTEISGEVAWVSSTSVSQGKFEGRAVNTVGSELVVLTRLGSTWVIRSIHWSSRKRT